MATVTNSKSAGTPIKIPATSTAFNISALSKQERIAFYKLTLTQQKVCRLIFEGYTTLQIAEMLEKSQNTVRMHVSNIQKKGIKIYKRKKNYKPEIKPPEISPHADKIVRLLKLRWHPTDISRKLGISGTEVRNALKQKFPPKKANGKNPIRQTRSTALIKLIAKARTPYSDRLMERAHFKNEVLTLLRKGNNPEEIAEILKTPRITVYKTIETLRNIGVLPPIGKGTRGRINFKSARRV